MQAKLREQLFPNDADVHFRTIAGANLDGFKGVLLRLSIPLK